eukprot:TRINITY_DN516_c0_g1_i1.p1 TRINITY_DN516_c0_g1~~TRINITY_DN516_c0_g1_i1.p1  ORF type:complete len:145 (-),score=0.33 TRINITY_DN516_c0_g1_i1:65-499(-)
MQGGTGKEFILRHTYSMLSHIFLPRNNRPLYCLGSIQEQFGKDREDRPSLVGKAIKSGYNSHYVVTKSDGRPVEAKDMKAFKCYDEIVIPQESQVTPFMLIRVDTRNFNVLAKEWNREVLIPGRSRDHMTSESDSYIPLLEQSF